LVAANARCALILSLRPGQAGDAPAGRELLRTGGQAPTGCHLIMDRAYEGDETRQLALDLGYIPVVPPKADRICPWEHDPVMYRVFSRFDKLHVMFAAFVLFALIVEALRISVNRP
jgi:transposase